MKFLLLQACTDCIPYKCLYEKEAFFPSFFLVVTFIEKNLGSTNKSQMPRWLLCRKNRDIEGLRML